MTFFGAMAGRVFDYLPYAIAFPWPLLLVFVSLLVARRRAVERRVLGQCQAPFWREVAVEAIGGIAAGFAGSLILLYLGITLSTDGFAYVFFLALFLMLLDLRYLCFAYAGGLLSLFSLITGLPKLHIPSLLALVAVLHITESLLILVDGDRRALPVYLQRPEGTVGGYLLQRVWPMPLICLSMAMAAPHDSVVYLNNPNWWPLIPLEAAKSSVNTLVFLALPAAVALGYGDLAMTTTPRRKALRTAGLLGLYSLALLALAVAAVKLPSFAWVAALFAPLGHELVLFTARRMELRGKPAFAQAGNGVTILAVLPNTGAERAGLRPGRVIVRLDGQPVRNKGEFLARLGESAHPAALVTADPDGLNERDHELRRGGKHLGLVLAPDPDEPAQVKLGPWRFLPTRRGIL